MLSSPNRDQDDPIPVKVQSLFHEKTDPKIYVTFLGPPRYLVSVDTWTLTQIW